MSGDKAIITDEHKFPFSLVSEFKHGHNREITKVGDVSELMDKAIGRLVFRVKGSVSANNYIEFDCLSLTGPILHIQMCLARPNVATIHLEVLTATNIPLRLTLSTLYNGDQPRFLGRSLRLPLPALPGWMILAVNLNEVLANYCVSQGTTGRDAPLQLHTIKKIQLCSNMLVRDIVTTDKELSPDPKYLPKELAVKPLPPSHALQFESLVDYCSRLPTPTVSPEALGALRFSPGNSSSSRSKATANMASRTQAGKAVVEVNSARGNGRGNQPALTSKVGILPPSPVAVSANTVHSDASALPPAPSTPVYIQASAAGDASSPTVFRINIGETPDSIAAAGTVIAANSTSNGKAARSAVASRRAGGIRMNPSTTTQLPAVQHLAEDAEVLAAMFDVEDPQQPTVQREYNQFQPPDAGDNYAIKRTPAFPVTNAHAKFAHTSAVAPAKSTTTKPRPASGSSNSGGVATAGTVLSKALTTPRHIPLVQIPGTAQSSSSSAGGTLGGASSGGLSSAFSTVKYSVPDTAPADRLLQLERLLGYSGGPAVLLYEGRMLLLATGSLLVMVDLDTEGRSQPKNGLFRAFRSASSLGSSVAVMERDLGFKQAFLRGHANPVGLIEVSEKEALMVTGETTTPNGQLILWDLREGKRLATLRPHLELLQCAGFSTDCAMLVTVGTDVQCRQQIVVWDIAQLIAEKAVNITAKTSALIAKQISEFPIQKIRFSPFEEFGLVSCGRENIRFWRIRKGHLPGRPVLLNEYARGFIFQDIGFHSDAGATPRDPRRPAVYVASNRGLLLRISCQTDQILCAYQLHTCAIRTLSMHSGYAVTGAEDNKLRLWPLDFSDFLLEAQHEGVVTNIRIALDGRKLAIGTAAGTLGVLNVSEHSYNTVLRSHSASVSQVVPCTFGEHKGTEFATVGRDNTVRIWNAVSGNQVIEFTSEKDQPTSCVYHPASSTYIACGYSSGFLRIFDVTTATAVLETRAHSAAIVCARYLLPLRPIAPDETSALPPAVLLATASLDGTVLIHDASSEGAYLPVKKISFGMPLEKILLEVSDDYAYLAVASAQVGSLTVFETRDFTAQLRLAGSGTSAGHERSSSPMPSSGSASAGADFPTAVMQSITYMTDNPVHPGPPDSAVPATLATAGGAVALTTATPATPVHTAPTVKPTFSSTASAAAVSSGSTSASTSGLHAPLVGLCFGSDRNGAVVLLATEKHLISVSACASSGTAVGSSPTPFRTSAAGTKRTATAWDERQSKRLECGAPTFMTKDPVTGLLLLALRTPLQDSSSSVRSIQSSSSVATDIANAAGMTTQLASRRAATSTGSSGVPNNKLSDVANAFAVIDWKFRPTSQQRGEKLSLSVPQVYQDLSDEIQGICPCAIGNKVVTVDATGSIAVWHLRSSNLAKVKVNLSAPSPSDALGPAIAREYRNTESGLSRNATAQDAQEARSNLTDAINEAGYSRELNSTTTAAVVPATPSTQALTRDFERAVLHDPSIWSANSAVSSEATAEQKTQTESLAEQVRSSLYEDNITSPAAAKKTTAERSTKSRTRMSGKFSCERKPAHAVPTADDLNTSTASYEIMFQEEDPVVHPAAELSLSMTSERSARASSELNNSRTESICRSATGEVAPVPVPEAVIDDPLAGLSVWKELQSPASADKSRSPMRSGTVGAVAMSQFYDSADEEESTSVEVTRQLDSLQLLQRARSNMQASRLGAAEADSDEDASLLQKQHQEFFTAGGDGEQVHVSAISHSNAVPPQFCQEKSMMVTCDGSGIYVKYVNSGSQVLLGLPGDLTRQRGRASITELRLHESGSMVAALVRHSPKNAFHLVVWVLAGFDELEGVDFDPANVEWRCVGAAALGVVEPVKESGAARTAHHGEDKGRVCLAWTPTGALLLLQVQDTATSTVPHISTNGLIKLTLIPADVIYAGAIASKWDEVSQIIQSPLGRIADVKPLPGVVVDEPSRDLHAQVPTVHAVIVGERRVMMVALTAPIKTRRGQVQANRDLVQVVWSDDLGARGPVLGLEAVRCSTRHIAGTFGAAGPLAPAADDSSALCREESDCIVAVLDSCGSIKFSVFSFYSQPSLRDPAGEIHRLSTPCVRSVTSKIPAANASGALRTMSVFAPRSRRSPHFLALAAAHDVRLFTLNLRELNAKAISVNLTAMYKVSLDSAPDYLLCLRPIAYGAMANKKLITQMGPAGHAPHLLVANHHGYMGLVPNARWVQGRHLPSTCLALQSPPLHCLAGAAVKSLLTPCGATHAQDGPVLLALCKGQLHMLHSASGIKLPFAGSSGIAHATCMEALPRSEPHSAAMLAVGSRCGRIALFDASSMQQQEIIALPSDTASMLSMPAEQSSNPAEVAHRARSSSGHRSAPSGHSVTSLRPLGCGGLLLAAAETGEVSVVCLGGAGVAGKANPLACIFSPSVVHCLPSPLYLTAAPDNVQVSAERMHNPFQLGTVLATVTGEARLAGVVRRHSNILELYFLHPEEGLVNFFNVSVKTPQDLVGNAESAQSAYFPANSPALHDTGSNIAITACHVVASDRSYVISIVGRVVPGGTHFDPEEVVAAPVFLFSGTVTLPAPPASTAQAVVERLRRAEPIDATPYLATLKQRVLLDEAPTASSSIATASLSSLSATAAAASPVALAHAALAVHNSVSFAGTHCAVVTADYIYVIDLLKSNASAPGSDVRTLCTAVIPCAAFNASWVDATALLAVESVLSSADRDEGGAAESEASAGSCCATSLTLTVYRKNKAAMLKFRINCM